LKHHGIINGKLWSSDFKRKGIISMKNGYGSFCLLGVLVLVLGVMLTGCDLSTATIGGGLILGGLVGAHAGHVFIGILIGGIIGFIIFMGIAPKNSSNSHGSFTSGGENDLFTELNKGSMLTIKDDYIFGPNGYRLGSIIGSGVHSRGRQIGNIKGNEIYSLDGNLICHIENDHLVK
jgi:hypothetical protein